MPRPKIETGDIAPTFTNDINFASNVDDIERPDLAIATDTSIDDPTTDKYIKDLQFMEQKVKFVVGKTGNKNDPNPLVAGCNGEHRVIELGKIYIEPRKFLNSLINTTTEYETKEFVDQDNLRQTRMTAVTTPSRQIQLLEDPSGQKGFEWFARAYHGTY